MSDFDKIRSALRDQGFGVEQTNRGHWRVLAFKDGVHSPLVTFSDSADPRAIKNTISDLRKIGFVWPPLKKNGSNYEPPEITKCPVCSLETFNPLSGVCENFGCASRAPLDTDSLYLEVKATKELVQKADEEVAERKLEVERATSALHVAAEKQKQLKTAHERLKQQLIKALED